MRRVGVDLADGRARVALVKGEGRGARLLRAAEAALPPRSVVRGEAEDPEAVGRALGELISTLGARGLRARVSAGPRTAVKRLVLPAMKPGEIEEYLRWQREKLFPFYEEAEMAYRVVARRKKEMELEVAASPRPSVERVVRVLEAAGLVPDGLIPEQEAIDFLGGRGREVGEGSALFLEWAGEEVRLSLFLFRGALLGRRVVRLPLPGGAELRRAAEPLLLQCRERVERVISVGEETEERRRAAEELARSLGAELLDPGVEPRFARAFALGALPATALGLGRGKRAASAGSRSPLLARVGMAAFLFLLLSDLGLRLALHRERSSAHSRNPGVEVRAQKTLENLLDRVERRKRLLGVVGSPWPLPASLTALVQGLEPGLVLSGVRVEGEGTLVLRGRSPDPLLASRLRSRLLASGAFSSAEVQVVEGGGGGLSFTLRAVMKGGGR